MKGVEEESVDLETAGLVRGIRSTSRLKWWSYYVPPLEWLPNYNRRKVVPDIIAGLSVASMLIPQGLAYATLARLPPIYGLYTAWVPLIAYFLLGSSRTLAIGPEAMVALLIGSMIDADATEQEAVAEATTLAFLCGAVSLLLGLLRFGFIENILSRPILSGFVTGVVLVIAMEQTDAMLGMPPAPGGVHSWGKLQYAWEHFHDSHGIAIVISASSLLFLTFSLFVKAKFADKSVFVRLFPEQLVVVCVGVALSYAFHLEGEGVPVVGTTTPGLPYPAPPEFHKVSDPLQLVETGLMLLIVGFVESIVIAKTYATKHSYSVSANRELVALGVANLLGSFFLAFPAFGSLGRSKVNDGAGGTTQLSGFWTSVVVLLSMLLLTPVVYYLPLSIMASIITVAVLALVPDEIHELKFFYTVRAYIDVAMWLVACIAVLALGIEGGLLLSVAISVFLLIRNASRPSVVVLGRLSDGETFRDIDAHGEAHSIPGVIIVQICDPLLSFANITQLRDGFERMEQLGSLTLHPSERSTVAESLNKTEAVVFDAVQIKTFDGTALHGLREMVLNHHRRKIRFCIANLNERARQQFLLAGLVEMIGTQHFFGSVKDAVNFMTGADAAQSSSYRAMPS